MDYPWKEQATLVRVFNFDKSDAQQSEILFEGPLLTLAECARCRQPSNAVYGYRYLIATFALTHSRTEPCRL